MASLTTTINTSTQALDAPQSGMISRTASREVMAVLVQPNASNAKLASTSDCTAIMGDRKARFAKSQATDGRSGVAASADTHDRVSARCAAIKDDRKNNGVGL